MNQTHPQTYHLYGRKTYPQPLTFIGRLEIEEATGLKGAALQLAGENGWIEMIAIPESSIMPIIVGGEPQWA